MGEIADMMLDGTLCEGCGELLDGEEPGHPRKCAFCVSEEKAGNDRNRVKNAKKKKGGRR